MTTINRVAFVGDYMPRQCGIATFTTDICEAFAAKYPRCECIVGAVNDRPEGYDYSKRIRFEIDEKEIDSYRRAADFLNINNVEVVSVQHEFGIYGGPAGSHLLALLRDVHMPVVTMLLTFGLLSPNKGIEYVIEALPAILKEHPNVVYIVLGATHPNLLLREGESYRLKLERLAEDRGVTGNVIFYNRFVTLEEL